MNTQNEVTGRKAHVHAEMIKAWADGIAIQYCYRGCGGEAVWADLPRTICVWDVDVEYRVKPPREFPNSSITNAMLYEIYYQQPPEGLDVNNNPHIRPFMDLLRGIADEAIKQYILDQEAGEA